MPAREVSGRHGAEGREVARRAKLPGDGRVDMPNEPSAGTLTLRQRRPCLRLSVLGGWSGSLESGLSLDVLGRKPRALLTYLALHAGQPRTRAELTTLLWGDHDEQLAGQSLRRALYLIRRALGAAADDVLRTEPDSVALSPAALDVDALEFER